MKGALLDTHALLWLMEDDSRLGTRAKELIQSGDTPLYASLASLWEMAVKQSVGKLVLSLAISDLVQTRVLDVGISLLDIKVDHVARYSQLPLLHRDPFDRLLVAQCLVEEMAILSRDERIDAYGVQRVWE